MVTRLDVILVVGLFPNSTTKELLNKMGKKAPQYKSLYGMLSDLQKEGIIRQENNKYKLLESQKIKHLFGLLQFCFNNSINYNRMVSLKTAEFVKLGLEQCTIRSVPFNARTVKSITELLAKQGFIIIESRKPFESKLVYSKFLEILAEYFFGKPKIKCIEVVECIHEEKLNSQLEKIFSNYKKETKTTLEFQEIEFIQSSLSLEGNTLSLPETEKLIKENISPKSKPFKDAQEVLDYKKAIDDFLFSDKELNLENILEFHKTAMHSLKMGAGNIRKHNVKIKGNTKFKTPDWKQLPGLLNEFFETSNQFQELKKLTAHQIVENASFLHNEFQHIHPFIDGNSRTSRAIFCKYLIENGFPLIRIPIGFTDQYMNLTKLSKQRNDSKFAILMKQITLENLKQALQKLKYQTI